MKYKVIINPDSIIDLDEFKNNDLVGVFENDSGHPYLIYPCDTNLETWNIIKYMDNIRPFYHDPMGKFELLTHIKDDGLMLYDTLYAFESWEDALEYLVTKE